MYSKHIKSAVAAAVLAGGLVAAAASPASALVTETDAVILEGAGFDFGGIFYSNGAPTTSGTVSWNQAWFAVIPDVSGHLHFEGMGTECARIRMISYDSNGVETARDWSDTECAPDDDHYSFFASVDGAVGAPEVLVTLQSETSNGWTTVSEDRFFYGPTVGSSNVQINRATFDFGTGNLVQGSPASPGTVTWNTEGSGLIRPDVDGKIYLNDTTECARMRLKYYSESGTVLATKYGGQVCGVNDELKKWTVNLHPYANSAIYEVKVSIEHFDASPPPGAWVVVGSQTATLN